MLAVVALAGCGGLSDDDDDPAPGAPEEIELTSPSFKPGGTLPSEVTCDGDEQPPGLHWTDVPERARSLALVLEDPDAPAGTFVHWTAWDIDPSAGTLIGEGPVEGENDFGDEGYGPPCPPEGDDPHRYRFILYALKQPLGLKSGAGPDEVKDRIEEQAVARGVLEARYNR